MVEAHRCEMAESTRPMASSSSIVYLSQRLGTAATSIVLTGTVRMDTSGCEGALSARVDGPAALAALAASDCVGGDGGVQLDSPVCGGFIWVLRMFAFRFRSFAFEALAGRC